MNFKAFSLVCTVARFQSARASADYPWEKDAGAGLAAAAACGSGSLLETHDFEDDSVPLDLTGGARRPWAYNDRAGFACSGSSALTAGFRNGVDNESELSITAPTGTTSLNYFYSYPSQLDPGDDFHVLVNDVLINSYELGLGETCASACISLSGGDVVKFRCASTRKNEICTIDNLQFFGLGAPTSVPTKPPTAPPTNSPIASPTAPPTDPPTNPPTDPPTDPPTAPPTDPPTNPPTNLPTAPPTARPTRPPTPRPTAPMACKPPYAGVNLCVALDMSGSVCSPDYDSPQNCQDCPGQCRSGGLGPATCCPNFLEICEFCGDVIKGVGAHSAPSSRFSAVTFSTDATVVSQLVDDAAAASNATLSAAYAGGFTNLAGAIRACASTLEGAEGNSAILLVTDGLPTWPTFVDPRDEARDAANECKDAGIYVRPVFLEATRFPDGVDYLKELSGDGVVTELDIDEDVKGWRFGGLKSLVGGVVEDVGCAFFDAAATDAPTKAPTDAPTKEPTDAPTKTPTDAPTKKPTDAPSKVPTDAPSKKPTGAPSKAPTDAPSKKPTDAPSKTPTDAPSKVPTDTPTKKPSGAPSRAPTDAPTTDAPTRAPADAPTTDAPTKEPTDAPTKVPTDAPTTKPTNAPSKVPTDAPTTKPTDAPSKVPTDAPTGKPTDAPSKAPTDTPTKKPTDAPSKVPTDTPTKKPTDAPSKVPTDAPSTKPTDAPTKVPTDSPTGKPTDAPSKAPTDAPTKKPTDVPTKVPTDAPTKVPTDAPTKKPTDAPTKAATDAPSKKPTDAPSKVPTDAPTKKPTDAPTNAAPTAPTNPPIILLETYDFEDDTVPLDIAGGADRPWDYNDRTACSGSNGLTAGFRKGVDDESTLSITAPPGTTSLTYSYSYPSQLDPQDDFHVLVNDVLVNSYELGPGETCASASIFLSGGDVVKFRCASTKNNEECTIDNLRFFGVPV